ncbi:hypothetical protein [Xanthomonas cucurbitae]|uniref:Stress-associated endoplasmic reticulum protein n=1 Tax=Xanthomonas cucurbitae TaxID=56453 RepID=A0ABY7YBV5_9XANT|nr:hypothetical protein [Xanthomonas cucurbitae]QHG85777.1 hypothetical protein EBN15_01055 [Xanthomonas cucurbitae]WDM67478.1 hypothetical protein K6981_18785 [Xanthomonas cucurbitae]WDM71354.1 hypothetical protein K6978_18750 [Xanthomonas cucurbitae]WDM75670.1 hypothetical protein K6982_01030 [Xanthomonas cucurbitae]
MGRKKKGISGLSFSWKRAIGISNAKSKLSRQLGVPLSKSGRQRKVGKAMGCCVPVFLIFAGGCFAIFGITKSVSSLIA